MASRYLRASGNWNGPVWAATPSGAAGSAATPTASDDVYILDNYTVTLTADAQAGSVFHQNGRVNLGSYELHATLGRYNLDGGSAKTLDMGSGKLKITTGQVWPEIISVHASNVTIIKGTSLLEINTTFGTTSKIEFGNYTWNDVVINLGTENYSTILRLEGSPTFRSLIIQSKNSAAHTVYLDAIYPARTTVSKLIVDGGVGGITIDNYLTDPIARANVLVVDGGSVYGKNVAVNRVNYLVTDTPGYIGLGSSVTNSLGDWLLQDPPKISTLVDPLTTAPGSNPNWTVSGTVTQESSGIEGGGYKLASGATMVSTDTFDLLDSELVAETSGDGLMIKVVETDALDIYISGQWVFVSTRDSSYVIEEGPDGATKFVKLAVSSGGVLSVKYSNNGTSWVDGQLGETYSLTENEVALIRSVRLKVTGSTSVLGSINVLPTPKNTGNFFAFFT